MKTTAVPELPGEGVRTASELPHPGNACCKLLAARKKPSPSSLKAPAHRAHQSSSSVLPQQAGAFARGLQLPPHPWPPLAKLFLITVNYQIRSIEEWGCFSLPTEQTWKGWGQSKTMHCQKPPEGMGAAGGQQRCLLLLCTSAANRKPSCASLWRISSNQESSISFKTKNNMHHLKWWTWSSEDNILQQSLGAAVGAQGLFSGVLGLTVSTSFLQKGPVP